MKEKPLRRRWPKNNYLLFVFAVIISLVIWIYMSFASPNTDTTFTIGDVPVQLELSEEAQKIGLKVFGLTEPKASVTVSGNRTVLGLVNENDLLVTASAGSISSAGNYSLPITATKRSSRGNYQITNTSPTTINVTVDYLQESTFQIQEGIIFYVEDNYYGTASLPYSSMAISGPQSEVLKVKKVVAKATISGKLTSTREVDAQIVLYDENNNEVPQGLMSLSVESMKATVTVLPEKKVPVQPDYVNKPSGLKLSDSMVSVTPSELLIAGPESSLDKITTVHTDTIDFSKIKNEKIDFDDISIIIPEGCKNISNYSTAKVSLDLSSFTAKVFKVDKFEVVGLSGEYTAEVTSKSINVTVIGPSADIEKLDSSKITAVIDTSTSPGKTGSVEMPVTFRFSGVDTCWAYGSYQANITINKK